MKNALILPISLSFGLLASSIAFADTCPTVKSVQDNALAIDTVGSDTTKSPLADLGYTLEDTIYTYSPVTINNKKWYLIVALLDDDNNSSNDVKLKAAQQYTKNLTTLQMRQEVQDYPAKFNSITCTYTVSTGAQDYDQGVMMVFNYDAPKGTAPKKPMQMK